MKRQWIRVMAIVTIFCWCTTGLSDSRNWDFESEDLTGWNSTGYVRVLGLDVSPHDGTTWTPQPLTGGNFFASLWSAYGSDTEATLTKTFDASAQNVLSFDYFFDFGDASPQLDTATATLTWAGGGNVSLFEYNTLGGTLLNDYENVNWSTVLYTLPETTTYTLEFHIENIGAFESGESILGIDNFYVTPVPSTIILGSLGLTFSGWILKRKRIT
jgi:hypothetical protein